FLRAQPFRPAAAGASHLALERESHKAFAALFGAIQRASNGVSAAERLCLKALRRGGRYAHFWASDGTGRKPLSLAQLNSTLTQGPAVQVSRPPCGRSLSPSRPSSHAQKSF